MKSMQAQLTVVQEQLKYVVELLAEHKAVARRLEQQQSHYVPLKAKFPIKNEGEFILISNDINDTNRNEYVSTA